MTRPVTLFTGQWADLPLSEMAAKASSFGYDGLELACWGDHFEVGQALSQPDYCERKRALLAQHGLNVWSISNHLVGQLVLDPLDRRTDGWVPAAVKGNPEAKRLWALEEMKRTVRAARKLGVGTVNGFTGSSIWHLIYPFPPVTEADINAGYELFAERWGPIFDLCAAEGVRFALEVHPTEIAFDIYSAQRALAAVGNHPAFGFNLDPSHLVWVGVNPVEFVHEFHDRIFHVHVKDAIVKLDGRNSILASHLPFGDRRRGWDFQSPGRGSVNFSEMFRALNQVGYRGPLSVEWEDNGMDREFGAREACEFVRRTDFPPASGTSFEEAFK